MSGKETRESNTEEIESGETFSWGPASLRKSALSRTLEALIKLSHMGAIHQKAKKCCRFFLGNFKKKYFFARLYWKSKVEILTGFMNNVVR